MPATSGEDDVLLSVRLLRPLVMGQRMLGRDPNPVLESLQVSPSLLEDPHVWVPARALVRAWELGTAQTPGFGLRASSAIDFGIMAFSTGPTDYLLAQLIVTSPTVGVALETFVGFSDLTYGELRFGAVEDAEGGLTLTFPEPWSRWSTEFVSFNVSWLVRAMVLTAEGGAAPSGLDFSFPPPPDAELYPEVLGVVPRFSAPSVQMRVDAATRKRPLGTARPEMRELLVRNAAEHRKAYPRADLLVERVRALLRVDLPSGNRSKQDVARRLGLSVRTLSRRLGAEGTTFQAILDEVRANRARALLADPHLTLEEVAERVGFADSASFHRAFRRWFGLNPGRWRERG